MKTRTTLLSLLMLPTGIMLLMGENGLGFLFLIIGVIGVLSSLKDMIDE